MSDKLNLKLFQKELVGLLKEEISRYGSQNKLSKATGISTTTLWRLKNNKTKPNFDMLCKLSEYFEKKGVY